MSERVSECRKPSSVERAEVLRTDPALAARILDARVTALLIERHLWRHSATIQSDYRFLDSRRVSRYKPSVSKTLWQPHHNRLTRSNFCTGHGTLHVHWLLWIDHGENGITLDSMTSKDKAEW